MTLLKEIGRSFRVGEPGGPSAEEAEAGKEPLKGARRDIWSSGGGLEVWMELGRVEAGPGGAYGINKRWERVSREERN